MDRHHVLLACGSDWQAPARLPRLFQRAGCHVTVLASPDWGITKTKFIDDVVSAPEELNAYVEALRLHVALNGRKYGWIIAVDDPLLESLVARSDEAWTSELLPLAPSSDLSGLLSSKAELAKQAADLSLPIPNSYVCDSLEEARLRARDLGYPIMLKLPVSYAGLGVRSVDDDAELAAAWSDLRADRQVVLQRQVVGKLGNTAVLYSRGRPLASMSALKSRTWPGPFGPSSARELMHHEAIDDVVDRFGARSKYDGFCAFDWILDSRDDLNVIELNARPVPALHMAKHVGVDFAEAISEFLRARSSACDFVPRRQRSSPIRNRAIFPMFPEDFQRSIAEADHAGLARFRRGAIGYDDIPWDDPPFLAHVLRRRATRRAFEQLFPSEPITLSAS